MAKVTVIGAGNVGGLAAARIAQLNLAEVVLLDIEQDIIRAKAFDMQDSMSFLGLRHKIKPTDDYNDINGSDIIVITAGFARKPGMSRDDLLEKNCKVVEAVTLKIKKHAPDAIIIMVTNPVDVLTYLVLKLGKFNPRKVFGMGSSLDNARLKSLLVDELDIPASEINSQVLGEHGNNMVILPGLIKIDSEKKLDENKLNQIIERTKNRGKEIVSLFKAGSAYFAPSAAICEIVKSILANENKTIAVSVYESQAYGEVCLGLPAVISNSGIEELVKLDLSNEEKTQIMVSAEAIKDNINKAKKFINV